MLIAGIGTAVPTHRIAQEDAASIAHQFACETAAQERLFHSLYRRSGVETRHSVVLDASSGELNSRQSFFQEGDVTTFGRMKKYETEAGALAVRASLDALGNAGITPERITHIVTVSCTGFHAPGFDIALIKQLPLRAGVARTHIGFMGCQGLINGLRVANAFVDADPAACVLACAVELCSLHHQYGWDAEKIVANALFADGAGAVVVLSDGEGGRGCRVAGLGATIIDNSDDAMSWRIGDHGFLMTLSPRVPEIIGRGLLPWLEPWLAAHGLSVGSVGSWAVHPGGPRILSAFGEATGLQRAALEPSYRVLAEYGNMSSPTILFVLRRLLESDAPRPYVLLAFGPGLSVEAALLN
jgi:predicted naringenin-chalcone synthase